MGPVPRQLAVHGPGGGRMLTNRRRGVTRTAAGAALVVAAAVGTSSCSLVPAGVNSALGRAIEVTAYFDSVAGLYKGNDVAVLGMPVGRITDIKPEGARVKVRFTVDKSVPVPKDVTAAIVNTSIVTTRHVELSPVYEQGERLRNGDTIKETEGAGRDRRTLRLGQHADEDVRRRRRSRVRWPTSWTSPTASPPRTASVSPMPSHR